MRSVLTALCLFASAAHAVPAQFTHQGRLLDADGVPLDGDTTITFRVTDSESGGAALWEEILTVPISNGFYSAVLGTDEEGNPLDVEVLSQAPTWLELQLEGEGAMFPAPPSTACPTPPWRRWLKRSPVGRWMRAKSRWTAPWSSTMPVNGWDLHPR